MYIHKTPSTRNICRHECPSLHLLRSDAAFLGHLFKIQEDKPIFSLPLKWNGRWGPLSPSVYTTAGTKPWPNVVLSAYRRTCLEDDCVQQKGIIDQEQERNIVLISVHLSFSRHKSLIIISIGSTFFFKSKPILLVEQSRCSPPALLGKLQISIWDLGRQGFVLRQANSIKELDFIKVIWTA